MENAAILAPNTVNIFREIWCKKRRLSFYVVWPGYTTQMWKKQLVFLVSDDVNCLGKILFHQSDAEGPCKTWWVRSYCNFYSTFCCKFAKNYCNKWNLDKRIGNLGQSNRENNQSNLCIEDLNFTNERVEKRTFFKNIQLLTKVFWQVPKTVLKDL